MLFRSIDTIQEKYVPNLRDHIVINVVGSPITNERFCMARHGNAYGINMTPKNVSFKKITAETPFKNLHWCNATSGGAGVYGTVSTGMNLYMDLTGDEFYSDLNSPSDEEFISALKRS